MTTTWIVAADASRARVLQVADRERLVEIENLAPPKFLGMMRKKIGKEVEKLIVDELPKDLSWVNARELEAWFAKGSERAT